MALTGSSARRYAQALLDLAGAQNAVEEYRASLERLSRALDERTLRRLGDPSVPAQRRIAAVAAGMGGEPESVGGLLRLLIERDRIGLLPRIAEVFGDLVDERAGIAKALVTTAAPLADAERERTVTQLETATGKVMKAEFAVDPALIGGATVRVGDHLVDASLRTRLDALHKQLAS